MKSNKRIGLRSIKTAVAVMIGLYLSYIFKLYTPLYTSIACVTSMQSSVYDSVKDVTKRGFTAVFGVTLGYLLSKLTEDPYLEILVCGFGVLLIHFLLKQFKLNRMASLSCIVFMASYFSKIDKFQYGLNRVIGTIIGMLVGLIVNLIVARPRLDLDFYNDAIAQRDILRNIFINIIKRDERNIEFVSGSRKSVEEKFEKLLKEYETIIHPKMDIVHAKELKGIFSNLEISLNLLDLLEPRALDYENRIKILEDFGIETTEEEVEESELSIVYNYQVANILRCFEEMEDILEKIKP
ncbi:aromatic acid exporter family protein [uncultured Peptoniphilus sp.]|uniref:FUSC family protein n=1 Tax=uncultured Peptoniphilus sp. TaxID=254354 RepID=UPI0028063633|nr:aromatic acid exporter family protein [uncultured Peptoniphilus sp.]